MQGLRHAGFVGRSDLDDVVNQFLKVLGPSTVMTAKFQRFPGEDLQAMWQRFPEVGRDAV